jgi:hypothetical protein
MGDLHQNSCGMHSREFGVHAGLTALSTTQRFTYPWAFVFNRYTNYEISVSVRADIADRSNEVSAHPAP